MSKNSHTPDLVNRGQSNAAVKVKKPKPGANASTNLVPVTDVEELYKAVNDLTNVGVTIELQGGVYELTP